MPLSKKHFISLAANIKRVLTGLSAPERKAAVKLVNDAIVPMCREHNSSFDKERFYSACGIEREER
jgi:hypothetical protein